MSSLSRTYNGFLDPEAKILVGERELNLNSGKKSMQVSNIHVEKSVGLEASTCMVKIKTQKIASGSYIPDFLGDLKAGAKIEISLGYSGTLKKVFVGYISSIDLEMDSLDDVTITVRGMDGKMLMMPNLKNELIKGAKTYSGAVDSILKKSYTGKFSGHKIKISGEPKLSVPIYQSSESDYAFVCRMASLAGALFFIENGKFYFVDMYPGKSGNKIFEKNNISKINLSVNLWGIPKKVETVSQDRKHYKQTITGASSKSYDLGSGKSASSLSKNIDGKITLIDGSIASAKEAEFASQVEQDRRNFNMVTTKIECIHGAPDYELGSVWKIDKVGKPVDGERMINCVVHDMTRDKYRTTVYLNSTRYDPQGGVLGGLGGMFGF